MNVEQEIILTMAWNGKVEMGQLSIQKQKSNNNMNRIDKKGYYEAYTGVRQ